MRRAPCRPPLVLPGLLRGARRRRRVRARRSRGTRAAPSRPRARRPPTRPDPLCRESYANDAPRGGRRCASASGRGWRRDRRRPDHAARPPEIPARRDAALRRLQGHRFLAVRLNRLFESDGAAGIARFKRLAAHYARLGLDVELQVRYHPRPQDDGDIAAWLGYVRRVVRAFGPNRHVTALQITNEVNITFSPNTSDGAYPSAVDALIQGVIAAKHESRRRGSTSCASASTTPCASATARRGLLDAVGRRGGARLRRATDWVGVDLYPGTYVPPLGQFVNLGDALLEGLAMVRECSMPLAGFGRRPAADRGARVPDRARAPRRGRAGAGARRARPHRGRLPRHLRAHRPPLVLAARQHAPGPELPVLLRAPARRLHAQAGVRDLPGPHPPPWRAPLTRRPPATAAGPTPARPGPVAVDRPPPDLAPGRLRRRGWRASRCDAGAPAARRPAPAGAGRRAGPRRARPARRRPLRSPCSSRSATTSGARSPSAPRYGGRALGAAELRLAAGRTRRD